jgi:hypothetical protein
LRFYRFPGLLDAFELLGPQFESVFQVGVFFPQVALDTLDAVFESRKCAFHLLSGKEEVATEARPE